MISKQQMNSRMPALGSAKAKLVLASAPHRTETRLLNRELSLVEFFRQVLDEGLTDQNPLLERLRFLTIFSNIVDEFFMVRVSGLKEEIDGGWLQPSPDGMTAEEQLREIRHRLRPMIAKQTRCLKNEILPELMTQGIVVSPYSSLSQTERARLDAYFARKVFPVLTPLAVDPAHPFPYVSGLSLNLGLTVGTAATADRQERRGKNHERFVRLKVPPVLPGLVQIDSAKAKFTFLSEIVAANLRRLFPGMRAGQAHEFRVTRDADVEVREDEADDLLRALPEELRRRRFGTPVRLEVTKTMHDEMLDYLTNALGLQSDDIYVIDGPLNVLDLAALCELNRPDLKYRPLRTTFPVALQEGKSVFDVIKSRGVVLP